jgi:type II secretory pathway pseudopilin PulG
MVLERISMDGLTDEKKKRDRQAGITMIELMMAGAILVITSLGMIGLLIGSIATNNRNKMDSTQSMLSTSILEAINSTFIGSGTSTLTDCAGTSWTIDTTVPVAGYAGANLSGAMIDFSQTSPPAGYYMNYVLNSPCSTTGALQGIYDVRWHLDRITGTNTFLLTVSSRFKNHVGGDRFFALPVTLRVMSGN